MITLLMWPPSFADVIQAFVLFVGGGGLAALWKVLSDRRREKRTEDREDKIEPLVVGSSVMELTQLLQNAAVESVKHSQAELSQARDELRQSRTELSQARQELMAAQLQVQEHVSMITRLRARVDQLIAVIRHAKIPVPDEEP